MAKRREPDSPFGPNGQLNLPPPVNDPLMFDIFMMWSMGITPDMLREFNAR
jgi:hypothetical protein